MATTETTARARLNLVKISVESQKALRDYLIQAKTLAYQNWGIRDRYRKVDLAYAREEDYTEEQIKAQRANRIGDANKFQNITVPVVLPQVEAAVTYQTSVFLTGVPLFGVVSQPDYMSQGKQLEALIDMQAIKGGWTRQFIMAFRNAFKYNVAPIEVSWENQTIPVFNTDLSSKESGSNYMKQSSIAWSGNCLRTLDPYNTFWDIRYSPAEVSQYGEFIGYDRLISRIELKQWFARNPLAILANINAAFRAPTASISVGADATQLSFYIPQISRQSTLNQATANQFNWLAWSSMERVGKDLEYKQIYQITPIYVRLIPSDFKIDVPAANTPQIWKLVWINNDTLIYAQPLSLAYDNLPIMLMQPYEDNLPYQTKSLGENGMGFQSVTSAMMNSVIAARRKAISDRTIYDPSRISEAHINSDNPSAKIPVRPAAYGKPVGESVYPFPFRDTESPTLLQEIPQLIELSNQLNGQNRAKQGQFVKGNKTMKEFDSVMANANGRDQLTSLTLEGQFFTPFKEMIKINILQFQTPATVYSREFQAPMEVDPVALRQASYVFKVSDGLVPAEKLINGDSLGQALNAIGASPQLASGYNLAPMFSYLMKTQGADLAPFEKSPQQMAYEQAAGQWQQTVQMMVETITKAGQTPDPKSFPPQPQPQAYGYVPGSPTPALPSAPIMNQYTQMQQMKEQQAGAANGQAAAQ